MNTFTQNINQMILEGHASPRVAVAVSGGSDSVALLLLANEWAKSFGAKIIALTVDHKMRDNSLSDCLFVQNLCEKFEIECHILSWRHEAIVSNVQAKARESRYLLLTDFCKKEDILYLCVGHHKDDVVENFFLRLMRGSGIFGLSLRGVTFFNNVMIMRPLLSFRKSECVEFLQNQRVEWKEDLSNQNQKFTRNKVRFQLASFVSQDAVISTQSHLGEIADTVIRDSLLEIMSRCVFISELGYSSIEFNLIRDVCQELQCLIIAHVLTMVRGTDKTPSFKSVKMVWNKVRDRDSIVINLHGCIIARYFDQVFIIRSFGKSDVISARLTDYVLWDKRFSVDLLLPREDFGFSYSVDRLRSKDSDELLDILNSFTQVGFAHLRLLYRQFLESLPVIRDENGSIVGIPHACYYSKKGQILRNNVRVSFTPRFVSKFVHFF